jgi:hypothetical protein
MKAFTAIAAALALLATAGVAYAAQLVSAPVATGVNSAGACYVRNIGNKPVPVSVSIFSPFAVTVSFDNCNGTPLAAGRTCVVLVNQLPGNTFVSCAAIAASVGKLRGTMEVRETTPVFRVLVAEDLR